MTLDAAQQLVGAQGNMLVRTVDGGLFAFGPTTMASNEAIELDTSQVVTVDRYFDGPIKALRAPKGFASYHPRLSPTSHLRDMYDSLDRAAAMATWDQSGTSSSSSSTSKGGKRPKGGAST